MSDKTEQKGMSQQEADEYVAKLIGAGGEGLEGLELDIFQQCQAMGQRRQQAEMEMRTWLQKGEDTRVEIQDLDSRVMALRGILILAEQGRRAEMVKEPEGDEPDDPGAKEEDKGE